MELPGIQKFRRRQSETFNPMETKQISPDTKRCTTGFYVPENKAGYAAIGQNGTASISHKIMKINGLIID